MARLGTFSALKEFHQTGKFTLLKNHVVSLETLSASALCQEKLFLTHLAEVEQLLWQLRNAVDEGLGLSSIPYTTKTLSKDLSVERAMERKKCNCKQIAGLHCTRHRDGSYQHHCGGFIDDIIAKDFDAWYNQNAGDQANETSQKLGDPC